MEGFIPVLIAIAYFVLQAYTGYKKEKEKAAKRQLGKPPFPSNTAPSPRPKVQRSEKRKPIQPQEGRPVSSPEPVYTDTQYVDRAKEYQPSEPAQSYGHNYDKRPYVPDLPPSLLDEYRKLSEYAEMEKVKAEKREALKSQNYNNNIQPELERLEMQDIQDIDDIDLQEYEVNFDVKQAVLAKAILDRPYS